MKTKLITYGLMLLSPAVWAEELSLTLTEALQKKLVSVKINGAGSDSGGTLTSSHYGPCIRLAMTNQSSTSLQLKLDYGFRLEPIDSSYQTMIVTRTLTAKLSPGQQKDHPIYAMCGEALDRSPSLTVWFALGKRATGHLLGLTEYIQRKNYQNSTAQEAVWCLTDNKHLHSIYSDDTAMMYDLRRWVARAKGLPVSDVYASVRTQPEPVRMTETIYSGQIGYSIAGMRPVKIMIALFDEDNRMKTVYVNNEPHREGIYNYSYKLSSADLDNKKHFLRLFREGKLEEEIAIIPRQRD